MVCSTEELNININVKQLLELLGINLQNVFKSKNKHS